MLHTRQECSPLPSDRISSPLGQALHDGLVGEIKEEHPVDNTTIKCFNTLRTSLVTFRVGVNPHQTKSSRGSDSPPKPAVSQTWAQDFCTASARVLFGLQAQQGRSSLALCVLCAQGGGIAAGASLSLSQPSHQPALPSELLQIHIPTQAANRIQVTCPQREIKHLCCSCQGQRKSLSASIIHFFSAHERDFPLAVSVHFHSFCPCLPPEWFPCSPTPALHLSKQDEC